MQVAIERGCEAPSRQCRPNTLATSHLFHDPTEAAARLPSNAAGTRPRVVAHRACVGSGPLGSGGDLRSAVRALVGHVMPVAPQRSLPLGGDLLAAPSHAAIVAATPPLCRCPRTAAFASRVRLRSPLAQAILRPSILGRRAPPVTSAGSLVQTCGAQTAPERPKRTHPPETSPAPPPTTPSQTLARPTAKRHPNAPPRTDRTHPNRPHKAPERPTAGPPTPPPRLTAPYRRLTGHRGGGPVRGMAVATGRSAHAAEPTECRRWYCSVRYRIAPERAAGISQPRLTP